jgi:protein-tyrosine phosphatase
LIPDLYWIRDLQPHGLAVMPRPRAGDWLEAELRGLRRAGLDVLVSLLTPEEVRELELEHEAVLSAAAGLQFVSFPIPDRGVPASSTALRALTAGLAAEIAQGRKVGIHCRMGIGRAGIVAACVMHALGVAPDRLFPALTQARRVQVPDTSEQEAWVLKFVKESRL